MTGLKSHRIAMSKTTDKIIDLLRPFTLTEVYGILETSKFLIEDKVKCSEAKK